jgi:O-antigen/teichoic acid export membrane protein
VVDFRTQVAVGVGWTALQKWLVRLTGLLTFVVLSRLLTPAEIGLVALALAVVWMLGVIADLGASAFLVQTRDWDDTTRNTVFWTALAASVAAMSVLMAGSAPLAALLGEPRLRPVLLALAPVLVLNAAGAVPTAVLTRELRFRQLALREGCATVAGAAIGVLMAFGGAGVWSLVAQTAVQATVACALVFWSSRWRPGVAVSGTALRQLGRFGGPLLGVNVLQSLRDRGELFLLGSLLGVDALGYWTVAVRLLGVVADLSVAVLDVVALPVFAARRDEAARFARAFESAVSSTQVLLVPALVVLAVTSPVLVPWAFGEVWQPAVLPAQVLCLGYGVAGLAYFNRAALLAHGRSGTELALTAPLLAVHTAMVIVIAPFGLTALAWGGAAEALLSVLVGALVLRGTVGITPRSLDRGSRVVVSGAVASVVGLAVADVVPGGTLVATLVGTVAALAFFALLLWVTNAELVRQVKADARRMVQGRTAV